MKVLCRVLAVCSLACCTVAYAADSGSQPAPMQQAVKSLVKNHAKNPDNQGLNNAVVHVQENQRRFAEKQSDNTHPENAKPERVERLERAERPDRPERPERPERVAHGRNH